MQYIPSLITLLTKYAPHSSHRELMVPLDSQDCLVSLEVMVDPAEQDVLV